MMNAKPICYEPGENPPEIFQGVPSFMGLPVIKNKNEIGNYDVVIMGAPWEGVVTWGSFSGVELATKSIRNASLRYSGYLPEMDFDIFDYFKVGDYGDSPTKPGYIEETFTEIQKKVSEIYQAGSIPIIFGGDHSTSIPSVRALAENTDGNVGIIHLDAHMDNMDKYGDEIYARCSPLHRIYEIENVNPKNIIHLGIRGPRNNPKQIANAKKHGASILTSFEIKQKGIGYAIEKALEVAKAGTDAVYVTVCSDILDVAYNPGGAADPNGLTSYELSYFLHEVACAGINGFDFVEVSPLSDLNDVSSHTAVWMSIYVLSGMVKNRFKISKES
ncbi:MAG: agmatinase family protein [Anaerolineales bacterium]